METSGPLPGTGDLLEHAAFLRRVARGMLLDGDAAEDVVQEAVLAGLRRPEPPGAGWRPWLAGVVRNLARMRHRGEARRAARERRAFLARDADSPAAIAARLETQRRLVAAVMGLPDAARTVVVRHYFDGLSLAEIARRQGVPAATVRARLKRGLDALRARFEADHDGDRRAWIVALLPLALSRGPATGVAGTALATAAVLGGELVMKPIVLAAAVLVVAVLAVVTLVANEPDAGAPTPAAGATARAPEPEGPAGAATEETLPATFDLAAADRDLDLFGTVRDPAGDPVAGADVRVVRRPFDRVVLAAPFDLAVMRQETPGPGCRTARDGTFRLRLRRGERVDLLVAADGFWPSRYVQRIAGERVDAVLVPSDAGGRLVVTVEDEEGRPVAGATARARQGAGDPFVDRTATTDGTGVAVVAGLREGGGGVRVEAPGRMPGQGTFFVGADGTARLRFVLDRGIEIRGTVRDAETGAPIAGAEVLDPARNEPVRTDEAGAFVLPVAIETPEPMYARAPGYAGETIQYPGHGPAEFRLRRGVEGRGRVVDADGRPVAGALVVGVRASYPGAVSLPTAEQRLAFAGEDGRFTLDGLSPEMPYDLVVQAPGHARTHRSLPFSPGPGEAWDLGDVELGPARRLEGRVVDGEGRPATDVLVRLLPRAVEPPRDDRYLHPVAEYTRADDQGRFRFADLPAGSYLVEATSTTGAMPAQAEVEIAATGDVPEVLLRLPDGRTLLVRIVDPAGRPVAGTRLAVASDTGFGTSATTDGDGAATIRGVPPGCVDVRIDVRPPARTGEERLAPTLWDVGVSVGEVTIPLRPLARATGRVVTDDGRPLADARVRVETRPGEEIVGEGTFTDADGRFEIWLAEGQDADLRVLFGRDPAGYGERLGVRAPADGIVLEVRRFEMNASVPVRVVGPDGEPVAGARVAVDFCGRRIVEERVLDADGAAVLDGVPDWLVWVEVRAPGAAEPPVQTFIADARKGRIDLRLRRAVKIEGRVLLPDGAPAPGARISAGGLVLEARSATADGEGRFSLLVYPDEGDRVVATWTDPEGNAWLGRGDPKSGEIRLAPTPRR